MDLSADTPKAPVVAIDLRRGHLDMSVATRPTTPEVAHRIIAANDRLFGWCRRAGISVIHQITSYHDEAEIRENPFRRTRAEDQTTTRNNVLRRNIIGGHACTVTLQLLSNQDWVVYTRKRYDCCVGTYLNSLFKTFRINTQLLTGINTNAGFLANAVAANVEDYSVIVVEGCVDTVDGPALHDAVLKCISTAFGLVMSAEAIIASTILGPVISQAAA